VSGVIKSDHRDVLRISAQMDSSSESDVEHRLTRQSTTVGFNRKQELNRGMLAELTSFLFISFTSTAVRLTVVTRNNTTHMAVHS